MQLTPKTRELMLNFPAASPPKGVKPNFVNPPNQKLTTSWVASAMLVLMTVSVGIRLFTKWKIVRKLVIEDAMLFTSWMINVGMLIPLVYISADLPVGVHQWDMILRTAIRHFYYFSIGAIAYMLSTLFLKIAIILQCIRVFIPTGSRNLAFWMCHTLILVHVIFYAISVFIEIFACAPRQKNWDPTLDGHCIGDVTIKHLVSGIINAVSDFIILLLSQRVIWSLTLSAKRARTLSALFLVGAIPTACSCVRIYYLVQVHHSLDKTYWIALLENWSLAELGMGYFAASVVVMPKFFKFLGKKPLFSKIGTSLEALRRNTAASEKTSGQQVSSSRFRFSSKKQDQRKQVSDIEYHELVENTLNMSMLSQIDEKDSTKGGIQRPHMVYDPARTV